MLFAKVRLMVDSRQSIIWSSHQRRGPRRIGLSIMAIVVLMWQLHGCMTPTNGPQMASQPVEPSAQIQLRWDPPTTKADGNPLTDIVGYKIHYGQRSRTYAFTKIVGNQTSAGVSGLVPGRTYFFAVTAHDSAGNESSLSDEVSKVAPSTTSQMPTLMQDAMARGQPVQFWVAGAQPGEVVSFLSSQSGEGEGPCSPQLGGLCVDLLDPSVFGEATADDSGTAILTQIIPTTAPPGQTISVQAVIRRGPDGGDSVKTNVITSRVTD
jgi:hypothetical protein